MEIWEKNWPSDVPAEITFKRGIRPLFEYLKENAALFPDRVAIIFYGQKITFRQLDDLSDRFAGFLRQSGVQKGDRVALFLPNCPQYLICHYGILKAGAVVGPCSPMFKEWELEYQINDMGAETIVTLDLLYAIVSETKIKTGLKNIVVTSYSDFLPDRPELPLPDELKTPKIQCSEAIELTEILNSTAPIDPIDQIDLRETAVMVYTSGTTGMPKGAMLTHYSALFKAACAASVTRIDENEVMLSVMPLYHIAGMVMGVNVPIYTGRTFIMLARFDPTVLAMAIEKYKVTLCYTATPMNTAMLQMPDITKYDFKSLRLNLCTSFGINLTEELASRWRQIAANCLICEAGYGLTESHTLDTFMPWHKIKYGSMGIPIHETKIKIVALEDATKEMPVGEQGEILLTTPALFSGYWNNPDATVVALQDGWLHTGDVGMLDNDGYIYLLGRKKEMIKCSGYSVFPEEVESLLLRHPAVQQVAVVGATDPVRGESVKAFVVLKQNKRGQISEDELIDWSKQHMSAYKYPRQVVFRDVLPATGAGKILRRLLKD